MSYPPQTPQPQGLVINSKTITIIVGACTIIAFLFSSFDRIKNYETRLDRVEYNDTIRNTEIQALTTELKSLNNKLTDLTIELKEMRAAQRAEAAEQNRRQ